VTRARRKLPAVAIAVVAVLLAGCDNPAPTPPATLASSNPPVASPGRSGQPSAEPSPTAAAATTFPLAVVTGLTNLKANIGLDELAGLAGSGKLLAPCGVTIDPARLAVPSCMPAVRIADAIEKDQKVVALLPPGLVEPATKVLPIAGDGPYGLFGPDLFGDPDARAQPYPIVGRATGEVPLDAAWTNFDQSQVWTLTETGSLCADRLGAYQAVKLGKGWDWVFDGGTARYAGKPFNNPNPPAGIISQPIVKPVDTGNDGATSKLISRADVTLGNLKCPVLRTKDWAPSFTGAPSLSVPEAVLTRWKDFLGIDAVYLPADHQSDRGVRGIRSTLDLLDKHGFPHTGLGMDLDQALGPAYVEVAGLKVAFVAWNNVPGPAHADATTPGVAWLTKANVTAAVGRAKAALETAEAGAGADASELERAVAADPDDLQARFDLAGAAMAAGNRDRAADELLAIVERDKDWNEGVARKRFLQLLEAQGLEDDWARAQRRRLSALLFT